MCVTFENQIVFLAFCNVFFFIYVIFCFAVHLIASVEPPNSSDTRHHSFISQVPDVRQMETALLGLLADFHSGKLRAFSSGCTMEQMTNIREQQEKLAKLHFDLGSATVPSLNEDNIQRSQNTMNQLIQRLEALSMSIEGLHNNTSKQADIFDFVLVEIF